MAALNSDSNVNNGSTNCVSKNNPSPLVNNSISSPSNGRIKRNSIKNRKKIEPIIYINFILNNRETVGSS